MAKGTWDMKQYPPRKHDKSKRIGRSDFPRFVLHGATVDKPTVRREIRGMLMQGIQFIGHD